MTSPRIDEALRQHAAGRVGEAVRIALEVMASAPEDPDALHILGVVALDAGRPAQAVDLIGRALRSRFADAAMQNNLGNAQRRLGQRADSIRSYRRSLGLMPAAAAIWTNLGAGLTDAGNGASALRAHRRSLAIDSGAADAHFAQALSERAAAADPAPALRRALALGPELTEAWFAWGNRALDAGNLDEAEAAYRRLMAVAPRHAPAWANRGVIRHRRGDRPGAEAALGAALASDPELADAHNALGNLRLDQERVLDAERAFLTAIAVRPDFAVAHYHRGNAQFQLGRLDAAASCFVRALACDPRLAEAAVNLGNTLRDQALTAEAARAYDRALAVWGPAGAKVRRAMLLPVIARSVDEIDEARTRFARSLEALIESDLRLDDPLAEVGAANFYLAYHGRDDRPLQELAARFYRRACPALSFDVQSRATPWADGRIAVGIVSTLLRTHTIGRLNHGLIRHLDRERFHVTVIGPEHRGDAMAEAIRRAADRSITIPRNLVAARAAIADVGLNVLYYPDLGMDPLTYFLAYARLAPLQVTSWGHPDTTGLSSIDFFLSCDAMEPRDADTHYTERLVRLPGPTVCIERPRLAGGPKSRGELGLPETATLYVCPQSLFKLHPDFDPVLRRILAEHPDGRLVLIHGKDRRWAELVLERLGPAAARQTIVLPMLSPQDFLGLLAASDVMLDPLHYSGGHTTLEAFALGVPVVTWPGRFMRARHTYGFYRLMGEEALVAADPERYAELALSLGRDRDLREQASRRVRTLSGVLFDHRPTVSAIGDFLEAALAARW